MEFSDIFVRYIRNGAEDISEEEELKRLLPILTELKKKFPETIFSVDTFRAKVAKAAIEIGKRLKMLAKKSQVIVVTHLPQVAAFGDSHYFIQKSPQKGGVSMEILSLNKNERVSDPIRPGSARGRLRAKPLSNPRAITRRDAPLL